MKFNQYKGIKSLKAVNNQELNELANDIRTLIYQNVMSTEGHLGSNMAIVDLTISLLQTFGNEQNHIRYLFDTGYQAYAFKMLTNRSDFLNKNHEFDGYSIFQDMKESDPYSGGHTSISAAWASGYNSLDDEKLTIEIIGDGSLATSIGLGGMLNFAKSKNRGLFILNDNKQGIGVNPFNYLNWEKIATGMGYDYFEVKNGHDFNELAQAWKFYFASKCNVFVKVNTIKGYSLTIPNPNEAMHYIVPAEHIEGQTNPISWFVKEYLTNLLKEDKNVMVYLPGMLYVFGLSKLKEQYPNQIIDAGIAEEISIIEACAAANAGKKVYFMVVASFSQRIYDQIVHDIARNDINLNILICGAGLSTAGDSHHGIYDLNMYNSFENIIVFHPHTIGELENALNLTAINGPKIFRMEQKILSNNEQKNIFNWEITRSNEKSDKVIITYGSSYNAILEYVKKNNLIIDVVRATTLNPLDKKLLNEILPKYKNIYTYELVIWKNNLASSIRAHYPSINIVDFSFHSCHLGDWEIDCILKRSKMDLEFIFAKIFSK